MATIDNFDSYTDGDLNGQGGWSSVPTSIDVQGTVVQAGAKAITRAGGLGGDNSGLKTITTLNTDGDQVSFYVRATVTNDINGGAFGFYFKEGATVLFFLNLSQDLNQMQIIGATTEGLGAAAVDTWYKLTIEFDFTNDRARAKVDAGTFSPYVNAQGSVAFSQVDTIGINAGGTNGTVYWDTLEDSTGGGGGATTLVRRMMTGIGT